MDLKISIIPYMGIGHKFIGHNSEAIFRPIGLKFCMVTQKTIIYRLVVRNHVFDAFSKEILFLAGKWVWPPRWRQGVWDYKTRPKSWLIGWTFWVSRYLEKMFSKFSGLNPPSLNKVNVSKSPKFAQNRRLKTLK